MRIIEVKTAAIGKAEQDALNTTFSFLSGKLPGLAGVLKTPNVRNFLTVFFDAIAKDPSLTGTFSNYLRNVGTAMTNDAKASAQVVPGPSK